MLRLGKSLAGVCVLVAAAAAAQAAEPVPAGRIKIASGAVFVVRADKTIRAAVGQVVFKADSLRTGADGRLGVTLNDDTRISLGPASEARLDEFLYAPADGQLGLVLKIVRGVMAYVSG